MEPAVPIGAMIRCWSIEASGDAKLKKRQRSRIAGWRSWRKLVVIFSVWRFADEELLKEGRACQRWQAILKAWLGQWSCQKSRQNWFKVIERLKVTRNKSTGMRSQVKQHESLEDELERFDWRYLDVWIWRHHLVAFFYSCIYELYICIYC